MRIHATVIRLMMLAVLSMGCEAAQDPGKLEIVEAWVRGAPASATVGAAYLTIRNGTSRADTLVLAESDFSRVVEMHDVEVTDDGTMKMHRLKEILVPANGDVSLEPSHDHLMLIGLKESLADGNYVPLKLTFRGAGTMLVMARIKR